MNKVHEIRTYDGEVYQITPEQAEVVKQAISDHDSHVDIRGVGPIAVKDIRRMPELEVRDDPSVMDLQLPAGELDLNAIEPSNEYQEKYLRLIGLNMRRAADKANPYERVPLLTSIEDLDRYEATGEWPEYVPVAQWRMTIPLTGVRTIWVKRRMKNSEYARYYAGHHRYYKLRPDGDDHVLVGHSYVTEGKALPDHLQACDEQESKRLAWLAGRQ